MVGKLSMRVIALEVAVETKTKDNVFVNLVVSVQYQVRAIRSDGGPERAAVVSELRVHVRGAESPC